jgi:hypothetical protein
MSERINWSYKVQAVGGPTLAGSGSASTDSYEKFTITVPTPAGTAVVVDVSAGASAQFLLLTSSTYENVTYKVGGGAARTLNGPILLVGSGAVALIGGTLNQFTFTNNGTTNVTIGLFIGRDATP